MKSQPSISSRLRRARRWWLVLSPSTYMWVLLMPATGVIAVITGLGWHLHPNKVNLILAIVTSMVTLIGVIGCVYCVWCRRVVATTLENCLSDKRVDLPALILVSADQGAMAAVAFMKNFPLVGQLTSVILHAADQERTTQSALLETITLLVSPTPVKVALATLAESCFNARPRSAGHSPGQVSSPDPTMIAQDLLRAFAVSCALVHEADLPLIDDLSPFAVSAVGAPDITPAKAFTSCVDAAQRMRPSMV